MIDFAHFLDRLLPSAAPFLIALAAILWLIAFGVGVIETWRRPFRARPRRPIFFRAATGFLVIVQYLLDRGVEARTQFVEQVLVDGVPIGVAEPLVAALRGIESHRYHHSHPTASFRVQLQTSQGPLELTLRRDSAEPREYWVYYPGFAATEANDVGAVFTDALDGR